MDRDIEAMVDAYEPDPEKSEKPKDEPGAAVIIGTLAAVAQAKAAARRRR